MIRGSRQRNVFSDRAANSSVLWLARIDARRDGRTAKTAGQTYNAEFAPDMEDVQLWRRIVLVAANETTDDAVKSPPT